MVSSPLHIHTLSDTQISQYQQQPLAFLTDWLIKEPQLAVYQLGKRTVYQVHDPHFIQTILIDRAADYKKSFLGGQARLLLGEGLITSEGAHWRTQRRTVQPILNKKQVHTWDGRILYWSTRYFAAWGQLDLLDVLPAVRALFLNILGDGLFGVDLMDDINAIDSALQVVMQWLRWDKPQTTENLYQQAVAELDSIIERIIAQPTPQDNLLSHLKAQKLTSQALRDQIMTILIAGQETLSNSFAWALYELAQQPHLWRKLQDDVDTITKSQLLNAHAIISLTYTRQVIQETLRLYPSAWMLGRQSLQATMLGDYALPEGALLMLSPYVVHRHPQHWQQPDTFNPQHFSEDVMAQRPRMAYFPFGAGQRQCIGQPLALQALPLCLANLAAHYDLHLQMDTVVKPQPAMNLRPGHPIFIKVTPRRP